MSSRASYIEHREYIFRFPQGQSILGRNVRFVSAQTVARANVDRDSKSNREDPGENKKVVVPADLPYDNCSTEYSSNEKEGSHSQRSQGDGEHGGTSIWNRRCRNVCVSHR